MKTGLEVPRRLYKTVGQEGPAFKILKAHDAKREEIYATVSALREKYGALKDRFLSAGPHLLGFAFASDPGKAWKAEKHHPGYYKPNHKNKAGQEIEAELKAIYISGGEELAKNLGLDTFFSFCGQDYCSAVGYTPKGDVYYLEIPTVQRLKQPDVVEIGRGEYYTAIDGK